MPKRFLFISLIILVICSSCSKENSVKNSVYFFGDSHINNWKLSYYLPDFSPINEGKDGAQINDVYPIINLMDSSSSIAVILIGTNDLIDCLDGTQIVDSVLNSYHRLVKLSHTKFRKILLINIFPLGNNFSGNSSYPSSYKKISEGYIAIASQFSNVSILDISTNISNDGYLSETYSQDGIHLNNNGYSFLSSETRRILTELY